MRNSEYAVRSDLTKIRFDQSMSEDEKIETVVSYFSNLDKLLLAGSSLKQFYPYLRSHPVVSRKVYDRLVDAHNEWAMATDRSKQMVPACCCCGWEAPDYPIAITLSSTSGSSPLNNFLKLEPGIAFRPRKEMSMEHAQELFAHLTSPAHIDDEQREAIYSVLQNNEVLGAHLFEISVSFARLGQLSQTPSASLSPVVSTLIAGFGRENDGGGCCCCC
ncbi:hypothetical protein LK542_18005, partial [Massilia sp. IC2-477]|uniref:hypothetical protein n=1 Tax=Massilia sp. IC2-477 TaxID=2887198 RepID=UPI001D10BA89